MASAALLLGGDDDEFDEEMKEREKRAGIVGNLKEQIRTQYDKGMLELRLQLVRMRTDYLNNINVQAALLASCSAAMLGSSELLSFEEGGRSGWWSQACSSLYVAGAGLCLSASVWVIYSSLNLINLSIHSTLYGHSMQELAEADNIIELRMAEVRLTFILSLGALFAAAFASIAEQADLPLVILGAFCFGFVAWHATESDAGTVATYSKYTSLQVRDRWDGWHSLRELLIPFGYWQHQGYRRYVLSHEKKERGLGALLLGKRAGGRGGSGDA